MINSNTVTLLTSSNRPWAVMAGDLQVASFGNTNNFNTWLIWQIWLKFQNGKVKFFLKAVVARFFLLTSVFLYLAGAEIRRSHTFYTLGLKYYLSFSFLFFKVYSFKRISFQRHNATKHMYVVPCVGYNKITLGADLVDLCEIIQNDPVVWID